MKNTSLGLSGKLDPISVEILAEIEKTATDVAISFFVVGATARDIILQHVHDIKPKRATNDIDIGVIIEEWNQFESFKSQLMDKGKFTPDKQQNQRLHYKSKFPIDIVPFGVIADKKGTVTWPPQHENSMNVAGFQESYQYAVSATLRSDPELVVKIASMAGLAIMKLIAWDDNPARRRRDATDLFLLMRSYIDAGNLDRLYDQETDLFDGGDFDYELASARLLGRDMAKISRTDTHAQLIEILKREADREQGHQIAVDVLTTDSHEYKSYEQVVEYFNSLLKGLTEK